MISFALLQSDPNTRIITVATVVTAVATSVYVVATILLWLKTKESVEVTRRMFETSQRPYVAALNAGRIDLNTDTEHERINFHINSTNAGGVFAHDVQTSLTLIVDGVVLPNVTKEETQTSLLLPNQPIATVLSVHENHELKRVKSAASLSLLFKCTYKGASEKEYCSEQRYTYNKLANSFVPIKASAT